MTRVQHHALKLIADLARRYGVTLDATEPRIYVTIKINGALRDAAEEWPFASIITTQVTGDVLEVFHVFEGAEVTTHLPLATILTAVGEPPEPTRRPES